MSNTYQDFLEANNLTEAQMCATMDALPPAMKEEDSRYEIKPSTIHGLGVFATQDLHGTLGKLRTGDGWFELGRYANHSDRPSAEAFKEGNTLYAKGHILKGEEITLDYFQVKDALSRGNYLVVDDFCPRIEEVVQSVRVAGFGTWLPNKGDVGSSKYEGMGFWGHHSLLLAPLMQAVGGVVVPNTMFFRSTNKGMENAYIHSDIQTGNYTAVVYLSEHEEPSGTAFYRHRPTGLTEMPTFQEMEEQGIFSELAKDMVSRDPDKWELLDFVEGKYNRALIFDAPLFHSRFPVEGIGRTAENGRLIWASHFYRMNGYGELF